MSEQTINPQFAIPRSKGKPRPVSRIQPGWWIHLKAGKDQQLETPDGWEQVDYIMSAAGITVLVFHGDQPDVVCGNQTMTMSLTEREAAKLGLRAGEVTP